MLLLFDIDGTLVHGAAQAHAQALRQALHSVHAVPANSPVLPGSVAGRTDGEIARMILLDAGVSAVQIDERRDDVRAECCRIYAEICPADLSEHVLPGVPELLDWLAGVEDVTLALVTGNFEPVARLKLLRAGIGRHFAPGLGAFGSDCEDRAALPAIARRRAGSDGVAYPRKRTIVIGDTPRDIACARADELRCFAVATGPHGADELTGADAVLADAGELRSLLEEVFV